MPLLLSGEKFHDDLYKHGCLALFAPLEGGSETRLLRRMRAKGFKTFITSARGLGDPEVFLLKLHGIRPPHLGHQNVGRNGALGKFNNSFLLQQNYLMTRIRKSYSG